MPARVRCELVRIGILVLKGSNVVRVKRRGSLVVGKLPGGEVGVTSREGFIHLF
jgi:hypothetical protein